MLKYADYDIVFQEIPDEITLAVNISGCPNRCAGCHSPHLMDDVGMTLDEITVDALVGKYLTSITCVCFMGGDGEPDEVDRLARLIRNKYGLKTGWYSGKEALPSDLTAFDYIKIGRYVEALGGLDNKQTNQRLYRVATPNIPDDITHRLQKI